MDIKVWGNNIWYLFHTIAYKIKEEEFNIDEYLDNKLVQNAQMTGQIKSTLSRFKNKFGSRKKTLMSESNSSEDNND